MNRPTSHYHLPHAATRPSVVPAQHTRTTPALDPTWQVLVFNDDVNSMIYVTHVFRKVFGYETPRAQKYMLEVHEQGRSVVWMGSREQAEHYVHTLQQWHLKAQLESHA